MKPCTNIHRIRDLYVCMSSSVVCLSGTYMVIGAWLRQGQSVGFVKWCDTLIMPGGQGKLQKVTHLGFVNNFNVFPLKIEGCSYLLIDPVIHYIYLHTHTQVRPRLNSNISVSPLPVLTGSCSPDNTVSRLQQVINRCLLNCWIILVLKSRWVGNYISL